MNAVILRKNQYSITVITLVIYFGSDSRDAPLSLKEIYSVTDSVILAHTQDYHINLIAPKEMSDDEINDYTQCIIYPSFLYQFLQLQSTTELLPYSTSLPARNI